VSGALVRIWIRHHARIAKKVTPAAGPARDAAAVEPALSLATWADAERLLRSRREALVRVDEPLVLVSQLQRSGGSLLNSLLDGHPQLHVHPYELHIGHPTKADWPVLDLDADADVWLEFLQEPVLTSLFAAGYRKKPRMGDLEGHPTLPFTVVPTLVDSLFRLLCAERPPASQREVIGHYLTAFFNAWIDNQGLREEPKRWVAAFGPRLAWGESRRRLLDDYPDGRVVALLRDPRAWYASASGFSSRYDELNESLALWRRGAEEITAAKRERPDGVLVILYEALVRDSERVMRGVAEWLGIDWSGSLLTPTFNRLPVRPNSSYGLAATGIRTEPLDRWREVLTPELADVITEQTWELYAAVSARADLREAVGSSHQLPEGTQ
jgi:hypothetical protein